MTTATVGPYEHTGAYRPDVIAQAEGTEPQWSDAPAESESPAADLSGPPLPSLMEFATALHLTIANDAYEATRTVEVRFSGVASALDLACAYLTADVADIVMPSDQLSFGWSCNADAWRRSHSAWRRLRKIRAAQLSGNILGVQS